MDAEAAAGAADREQHLEDVGTRLEQLAELVDDDHQVGHRRQVRALPAQLAILDDPLDVVSRGTQLLLAALELAGEGGLHPVDQGEVVREIRDHAAAVREPLQQGEREAALEVGERQLDVVRPVGRGERAHQGAQQLALA